MANIKINIQTNGTIEENIEPGNKVKLTDLMSFKEIQELLKKKQEEFKATLPQAAKEQAAVKAKE